MYKTIIFDLDGTLLDTLDDLTSAVNHALSVFGLANRTKDEVRGFIGNGIALLMQRAIGFTHAQFDNILAEFKHYYNAHCANQTKPYKGVMAMLRVLKAMGVKTAVVSNKADFATRLLVKEYFGDLIDEAVGENEEAGVRKKPAPDSVFAVMQRLNAPSETCVYIGDSEVDIQTAHNAGIACISVTWGFKDEAFLREHGAKTFANTTAELLTMLLDTAQTEIGNTPLVALQAIQKRYALQANIFAKMENFNPGGSIKDRAALSIIEDAEARGVLRSGGTVIEATSGNTGIGLAWVAKSRGYRAVIVMPDSMSEERQQLLKAYGAELVLTDGALGMQGAVEYAQTLVGDKENCLLAGQFENPANPKAHYLTTGKEIYQALGGKADVIVAGVGTGGTITGIARYIKENNPKAHIVAVEPATSPLLSKGVYGAHCIQGIGANFIPKILDLSLVDEVMCVTDDEAYAWTRTLLDAEGAFVGISSGAALCAAVKVAQRTENAGKNIVVIFPDDGGRYLTSGIFD